MVKALIKDAKIALYIAEKDVKIYFLKGPNLTFGLLLPVVLYLAFAIGKTVDPTSAVPGLVSIASFFGAGAIQAISLPLERRTGTFSILLAAPTRLFTIIFGKALAGSLFGIVLSLAYTIIMMPLSQPSNVPLFLIGVTLSSFMFSTFGLFLSAPFRDIPQAMPPATVVRIAMVFLCGVFTPIETMPPSLQAVAYSLPLTYSVDALRQAMSSSANIMLFVDLGVQVLYSIIFLVATTKILERTVK